MLAPEPRVPGSFCDRSSDSRLVRTWQSVLDTRVALQRGPNLGSRGAMWTGSVVLREVRERSGLEPRACEEGRSIPMGSGVVSGVDVSWYVRDLRSVMNRAVH